MKNNSSDAFQDFCSALGVAITSDVKYKDASTEGLTQHLQALNNADRKTIGSVYSNVIDFLNNSSFIDGRNISSRLDSAVEHMVESFTLRDVATDDVLNLVGNCGVHPMYAQQAAQEIAVILQNSAENGYAFSDHFHPSNTTALESFGADFGMMYAGDSSIYDNSPMVNAALESFGAEVNSSISDVKLAATVAILRYHHSTIQRALPVVPATSNMVMYKVDYNEVYDLSKQRDDDGKVRQGAHRFPFVQLYEDAAPANTEPHPIVPKLINDTASSVLKDGVLVVGKEVNLFDLARVANKIGSSTDYTDVVSDGVQIVNVFVTATNGTDTEQFVLNVIDEAGSRLILSANNTDSGDRSANLRVLMPLIDKSLKSDGTVSALLNGLSADCVITLDVNVSATISLKSSITTTIGQLVGDVSVAMKDGSAVAPSDLAIAAGLSFKIAGVELDAKYSEENLRKSTKALRIMSRQQSHVIKGSTNAVVQFSISDAAPESVVDGLSRLLAVGNDDRGIKAVKANLESVAAAIAREKLTQPQIGKRVADSYVSGHRVRPYVHVDKIDIRDLMATGAIQNEKASELLSDIRSYVEKKLLEVVTRIHNESFYPQELGMNNTPEYTIITSSYILNTLFQVQHMHNHMDKSTVPASGPIEYRRILPNGTILNFVTTTFSIMRDKMFMFPVISDDATSTLNYASIRTRGTYVSKATATIDAGVRNMIVANQREIPIVTNPVGAYITVSNISDVFTF